MRVGLFSVPNRVDNAYRRTGRSISKAVGMNTGNLAFISAIADHIDDAKEFIAWDLAPEAVRERADIIVIPCANFLGPHSDFGPIAERLEKIGRPIVAIGLGAQSRDRTSAVPIPDGTRRWLETVASHAPSAHANITMRGEYSWAEVSRLGLGRHAVIAGCPSNALNPSPDLEAELSRKYESREHGMIAVAAGLHHWRGLAGLERHLISMMERSDGEYIVQSELEMIQVAKQEWSALEGATLETIRAYLKPGLSLDAFKAWARRYATLYTDVDAWMSRLTRYDFVVGPRFHGVLLALQAGVPGGVVTHDSRTEELCETMCIPFRNWAQIPENVSAAELYDVFPFDTKAYFHQRRHLTETYVSVLKAAGLTVSSGLASLCQ